MGTFAEGQARVLSCLNHAHVAELVGLRHRGVLKNINTATAMKTRILFIKLTELFLLSDEGTKHWADVLVLRRLTFWIVGLALLNFSFFMVIIITPVLSILESSATWTLVYRCWASVFSFFLVAVLLVFTYKYVRYTLTEGGLITLHDIGTFYFMEVFFFFMLYASISNLFPDMLAISQPTITISSTLIRPSVEYYRQRLDLLLFSAFQSVNGSYYRVRPNSIVLSIFAYIQSLYTLVMIAIVVSSYVNRHANKGGGKILQK